MIASMLPMGMGSGNLQERLIRDELSIEVGVRPRVHTFGICLKHLDVLVFVLGRCKPLDMRLKFGDARRSTILDPEHTKEIARSIVNKSVSAGMLVQRFKLRRKVPNNPKDGTLSIGKCGPSFAVMSVFGVRVIED